MFSSRNYNIKTALAAIAVAVAAVVVYFVNPIEARWMPKCPFYTLTGLKCPSCGITRTTHSAMHLRLHEAWLYNPMMPVLLGLALVIIYRLLRKDGTVNGSDRLLIITYLIIYIAWWVTRNIIDM